MSGDVHPAWAPVFARAAAWWAGRDRYGDPAPPRGLQASVHCANRDHGKCNGSASHKRGVCDCYCHGVAA